LRQKKPNSATKSSLVAKLANLYCSGFEVGFDEEKSQNLPKKTLGAFEKNKVDFVKKRLFLRQKIQKFSKNKTGKDQFQGLLREVIFCFQFVKICHKGEKNLVCPVDAQKNMIIKINKRNK
jgi:hypothetical protein